MDGDGGECLGTNVNFCYRALLSAVLAAAFGLPARSNYLPLYLICSEGTHLERNGDYLGALVDFQTAADALAFIARRYPDWETRLVQKKLTDCQNEVRKLTPLAGPQISTSLQSGTASIDPPDQIYQEAMELKRNQNSLEAAKKFEHCRIILAQSSPNPENAKIISDCGAQIESLQPTLFHPADHGTLQ